jgi:signal transduction histidine kinase
MKTIASNTFLLVDNMLNWAKIRQGQIALDNQVILLTDKLEEVLGYIQFALKTKRIQLVYRFKKDFSLQADQVLITSLLLNLITNAAKFSEEGSKIVIKASKKDNHSVIQIQDEGIGFEPQLLAQIQLYLSNLFDRLVQCRSYSFLG